jgi:TolB-like protein
MGWVLRKQVGFVLCVSAVLALFGSSGVWGYEEEIKQLSAAIANDISGVGKQTIAVVDFTDLQGNVTEFGRFVAEEMSVDLAMSGKGFRLIDRTHMKSVLNELALSSSELFDPKKSSQVGKLTGADAIVTGSIVPFGDNVRVTVKVIATETAGVISAAKRYIAKTTAIEALLNAPIVTVEPVKKRQDEPKQTRRQQPRRKAKSDVTWDFETGDLRGWEVSGDAFMHQPTYGDNPTARRRGQPSKHVGEYWIGGYEKRSRPFDRPGQIQGDGPQGTLTSEPFYISKPVISFLIGGGCDISKERVDLIVDGRVVRSVTGKCNETMHRHRWDVTRFIGKTGRIQLVDAASGGWGHLNFDDLRFEGD